MRPAPAVFGGSKSFRNFRATFFRAIATPTLRQAEAILTGTKERVPARTGLFLSFKFLGAA